MTPNTRKPELEPEGSGMETPLPAGGGVGIPPFPVGKMGSFGPSRAGMMSFRGWQLWQDFGGNYDSPRLAGVKPFWVGEADNLSRPAPSKTGFIIAKMHETGSLPGLLSPSACAGHLNGAGCEPRSVPARVNR